MPLSISVENLIFPLRAFHFFSLAFPSTISAELKTSFRPNHVSSIKLFWALQIQLGVKTSALLRVLLFFLLLLNPRLYTVGMISCDLRDLYLRFWGNWRIVISSPKNVFVCSTVKQEGGKNFFWKGENLIILLLSFGTIHFIYLQNVIDYHNSTICKYITISTVCNCKFWVFTYRM